MAFAGLRQSFAQVCLGVDAVELRRLDEGVDGCRPVTADVRTCEKIILPTDGNRRVILPVADAAHAADRRRPGRIAFHLPAQTHDAVVDRSVERLGVAIGDGFQQPVAREGAVRVFDEQAQQLELAGTQVGRLAVGERERPGAAGPASRHRPAPLSSAVAAGARRRPRGAAAP